MGKHSRRRGTNTQERKRWRGTKLGGGVFLECIGSRLDRDAGAGGSHHAEGGSKRGPVQRGI